MVVKGVRMNRRETVLAILALGAAGSSLPLAAQAKIPRLGVLITTTLEPFASQFRDELRKLGYSEGKSVQIEFRAADGKLNLLPGLAEELVRLNVDIIIASLTPAAFAARQATRAIPVVMAPAADPVGSGLVASLARPGGNITGLGGAALDLAAKTIEVIREIQPSAKRVTVLASATDPFTKPFLERLQNAAKATGIELTPVMIKETAEFKAAFRDMVNRRTDAVLVQPSLQRKDAAEMALSNRIPAYSFSSPAFIDEGGLLAYSANAEEQVRRSANYVDKILRGAKPADLPVEQPTRFELAVNLKTAKALGLKISQTVLLRVDRLIE
jgi:putative ABC transport system substrate-binding protein